MHIYQSIFCHAYSQSTILKVCLVTKLKSYSNFTHIECPVVQGTLLVKSVFHKQGIFNCIILFAYLDVFCYCKEICIITCMSSPIILA